MFVSVKTMKKNLNYNLLVLTFLTAFYVGGSAWTENVVINLRKGIAKGICSYSQNYFVTAQIQPPLRDSALFPESDEDQVNCAFLKWKLIGREQGDECPEFKCVSPQGVETIQSRKSSRIVGGTAIEPHEFPHMVTIFLTLTHSHNCGGTIINAKTIVTAAHCVLYSGIDEYYVYAGKHNLSKEESSEQKLVIKSIIVHEAHIRDKYSLNDIALIKLERPLIWTPEVQPALLPAPEFDLKADGIVTGWGQHHKIDDNIDVVPEVPSKVTLAIVPLEVCRQAYASKPNRIIYDTVLCAGEIGVQCRSACYGDSGGPFGFPISNGSFVLRGIASSLIGCGRADYPGVFTDVTKYVKWINANMH